MERRRRGIKPKSYFTNILYYCCYRVFSKRVVTTSFVQLSKVTFKREVGCVDLFVDWELAVEAGCEFSCEKEGRP